MADDEEIKNKLMEHDFRLQAYERLLEQHNVELSELKNSNDSLKNELSKVTNRLIIAMIVVALLGENAVPLLAKLAGM